MAVVPRALTIAGSDSGGGAGIQADLKTFSALGVYGASAITAVTAQDTKRVYGFVEMEPAFVVAQIDAVLGDIGADAVKTGMLSSAPIIEAVAEALDRWEATTVVVDPVMVAKGGDRLLRDDAIEALKRSLLPRALIVTPNIPEAEVLAGARIETPRDIEAAAREIHSFGVRNVLIKGGHLDDSNNAIDFLFDGQGMREFRAGRVDTTSTHGTGCTLASAIAAGLARGEALANAILMAKAFVTKALQSAYPLGSGHGPVHHFYRTWRPVER